MGENIKTGFVTVDGEEILEISEQNLEFFEIGGACGNLNGIYEEHITINTTLGKIEGTLRLNNEQYKQYCEVMYKFMKYKEKELKRGKNE